MIIVLLLIACAVSFGWSVYNLVTCGPETNPEHPTTPPGQGC